MYIPFGSKLIELAMGREDEKSNLSITEHRELLSLLEQPRTPLAEGHLPVHRVLDPLHLSLSASHLDHQNFPNHPKKYTCIRVFGQNLYIINKGEEKKLMS